MYRRTVQRVVMGISIVALLGLTCPAPAEAAGFDPARVEDLWSAAWEWLAGLWGGPEAGASLRSETGSSRTSSDPDGGNAPDACKGDEGACVDPNGG